MPREKSTAADFIEMFERLGAAGTAKALNMNLRKVYTRRENLEKKIGRQITSPNRHTSTRFKIQHPGKLDLQVENGVVLVASDCHYWPGVVTTAHRAFVKFCKEMAPKAVVMNGDVLDGATISRHPPIGWEGRPTLIAELEACQERLEEIRRAAKNAILYWNLGNHDGRFETRLATVAPEYAKLHGVHLKDHFPHYLPCWMVVINDEVVVKHRFKNGIHATHNNTIWAGKTVVTGHLHSSKVTPFSDYNGTRYGVDTGTLAEPYSPQFADYTELNPTNWRSGFVVLTFHKGRLLWPEVVHVCGDGEVEFRGRVINV